MDFTAFLEDIRKSRGYSHQIVYIHRIPRREAAYAELAEPLPPELVSALAQMGITNLYTHQVRAIENVRAGRNIVVVTSTASGKTLCYNLPVLEALLSMGRRGDGETGRRSTLNSQRSTAFYLFPTKALAQDQLRGLRRYAEIEPALAPIMKAGAYDGDTPTTTRRKLRDEASIILTNPDMLHQGILPYHSRWSRFFADLRCVVIDEIHTYRGIFGSNVANVIRRLSRICRHYASNPTFVCSSATIANPVELAEKLTGVPMVLVDNDGSPRGAKQFVFWNPPCIDVGGMERRSSNVEAQQLMTQLMRSGVRTITFGRARVVAELMYRYVRDALRRADPALAEKVRAYRGGYLPEERREIERQLFTGELMGITSTNALELGIDIGGLDAAIIIGFPGTIASTWQQAGRAGRSVEESLVVFVGYNDPIDQYLMRRPEYFFGQSPEHAIIDADNPYILASHMRCAAFELPLKRREGETPAEPPALSDQPSAVSRQQPAASGQPPAPRIPSPLTGEGQGEGESRAAIPSPLTGVPPSDGIPPEAWKDQGEGESLNTQPSTLNSQPVFGPQMPEIAGILEESGDFKQIDNTWYWSRPDFPAADVNLRTISDNTFTIVEMDASSAASRPSSVVRRPSPVRGIPSPLTGEGKGEGDPPSGIGYPASGQVIGQVDSISAPELVYPGAVYMHEAQTYFVEDLDLANKVAYVRPADVDYYTQAILDASIRIQSSVVRRPSPVPGIPSPLTGEGQGEGETDSAIPSPLTGEGQGEGETDSAIPSPLTGVPPSDGSSRLLRDPAEAGPPEAWKGKGDTQSTIPSPLAGEGKGEGESLNAQHSTLNSSVHHTDIRTRRLAPSPHLPVSASLFYGPATVTWQTTGFKKIKFYSLDSIGYGKVDIPPQHLETTAFWIIPPAELLDEVRRCKRNPVEGLVGIRNLMVHALPLFAMCDKQDIGGIVDSSNTGSPTIFIYDRYPGGLGFAEKGFEMAEELMRSCLAMIEECGCEDGCPSCVGIPVLRPPIHTDPDVFGAFPIPDKEAARMMLRGMAAHQDLPAG